MSRRSTLLAVAALSLSSTAVLATSTRSDIDRQYKRWVQASLRLDVSGVLAILTKDYTLKTFDGKLIPLKMYEQSLRKRKEKGQRPAQYTTSIQSLSKVSSVATVISLETSITDTPDPITLKIQKLVHIHQYRDIWKMIDGNWKLAQTVTLLEKTTILKPNTVRS